jgi:hypothetical protein
MTFALLHKSLFQELLNSTAIVLKLGTLTDRAQLLSLITSELSIFSKRTISHTSIHLINKFFLKIEALQTNDLSCLLGEAQVTLSLLLEEI